MRSSEPREAEDLAIARQLAHVLASARLSSPAPPLLHDGPCGRRAHCPNGCNPVVRTLELLERDGSIVVRCCLREVLRPDDPRHPAFAAAFE